MRIKFENGKWLLKCVIKSQVPASPPKLSESAMGIDVGVKSLAVVSMDGVEPTSPLKMASIPVLLLLS